MSHAQADKADMQAFESRIEEYWSDASYSFSVDSCVISIKIDYPTRCYPWMIGGIVHKNIYLNLLEFKEDVRLESGISDVNRIYITFDPVKAVSDSLLAVQKAQSDAVTHNQSLPDLERPREVSRIVEEISDSLGLRSRFTVATCEGELTGSPRVIALSQVDYRLEVPNQSTSRIASSIREYSSTYCRAEE